MTALDELITRYEETTASTAPTSRAELAELRQRAEAAESHAAQAEAERDDLRVELDTVNMLRTGSEAACDELRRQLTEAQHAIDVLSQTIVAQDATIKRLEQAHEDVADYRIRVNELFEACKAARDWFDRNTKQGHTPGPVEKMLIDAISKADVMTA